MNPTNAALRRTFCAAGLATFAGAALACANDMRRRTTQFDTPSNPIGRDGWEWRLGVNFHFLKDGLTGGLAYSQEEGRNHQKSHKLTAKIGLRF